MADKWSARNIWGTVKRYSQRKSPVTNCTSIMVRQAIDARLLHLPHLVIISSRRSREWAICILWGHRSCASTCRTTFTGTSSQRTSMREDACQQPGQHWSHWNQCRHGSCHAPILTCTQSTASTECHHAFMTRLIQPPPVVMVVINFSHLRDVAQQLLRPLLTQVMAALLATVGSPIWLGMSPMQRRSIKAGVCSQS